MGELVMTIEGKTGDWSTALIKTAASIKTYSDGYYIKIVCNTKGFTEGTTKGNGVGACFKVGDNVTCFTMNNATGAADAVKVVKADVGVGWLKKKEWEDNGAKAASTWTASWYQPKETKDKKYVDILKRFQKAD